MNGWEILNLRLIVLLQVAVGFKGVFLFLQQNAGGKWIHFGFHLGSTFRATAANQTYILVICAHWFVFMYEAVGSLCI